MPNSKTTFPFKKEKGPNGLTAIYVPMKSTKTVAVLVLVGTGSRYETKDINGISHFLEHMAFKGTQKRPNKREIAQELDSVGASYNAFTDKDVTGYWVKVDASNVDMAMDVVADIFLNSTLPAEEIEKEKGVIIGEIDMYEDMPMHKVSDVFDELLYGKDHPMGWDIAGKKEIIRKLKREDFISYRHKFYKASNTVVVVAGNVTIAKGRSLVKKYFNDMPSGKTPSAKKVKIKQIRPQSRLFHKKTDQTHLILGTGGFKEDSPKYWASLVLSTVLGGNMSSRLFIRVRDELSLGYYVRSGSYAVEDHGYFWVKAGVDKNRVEEAVTSILEELSAIKKDGPDKKEILRARDYLRGTTLLGLESSYSLAAYYGEQEISERKILTPEQKFRMINKVTREDVKKVAREIFQSKKLNLALVGPHRDDKKLKKLLKL